MVPLRPRPRTEVGIRVDQRVREGRGLPDYGLSETFAKDKETIESRFEELKRLVPTE